MQLFGHALNDDSDEPQPLSEVSLVASVQAMRELASFLIFCANEMDEQKKPYGVDVHFHLRDFSQYVADVDVIVVPTKEEI